MQYHGKGGPERAVESRAIKAKKHNDPLVHTDWARAKSSRDAFKQENKRLQKDVDSKG